MNLRVSNESNSINFLDGIKYTNFTQIFHLFSPFRSDKSKTFFKPFNKVFLPKHYPQKEILQKKFFLVIILLTEF